MKKIIAVSLLTMALASCSTDQIDSRMTSVGKMGDVSITDMRSAVVNNLLVAQTTFHNDSNGAVNGFYRCQFFDANSMQVGDAQIWQPITLYAGEDQAIKCVATQIEATDFKVEFSADGKNVSVYKYK